MKFREYNEIENTYNQKFLDAIHKFNFDDPKILYQCFTKVDGANLQCSIDEDDNFVVGSRTQILKREDSFLGFNRAMRNEDVELKLREMKKIAKEQFKFSGNFILTVFGELCGGYYRHPQAEKVKGAVKVQGRVDYHPDNMWIPFDILIRSEEDSHSYLASTEEVKLLCDKVGLPSQILRFTGTLAECLQYPNDFIDDTGNKLWSLPIVEGNITEGVVIKPVHPIWFPNGKRVVLKNKNEKFKERTLKSPKEAKEVVPMNELEKKYFELAREFITESRLMSVFSKVDFTITQKSFGPILGSFMKDLWNDFDKEYKEEIDRLNKELTVDEFNFTKARKEISKEVSDFIRPLFVQKLNGF